MGQGTAEKVLSDIPILYEDADLLVVDKPSGMLVHNDGHAILPTLVDWHLSRVPPARGIGEGAFAQNGVALERSGVVHRLDKDTSGVLVLVKTQEAFEYVKHQFHDRLIKKEYRAFVYGTMKEKWGTINRPIGRSAKDFRLRSAEGGARGVLRQATTDWELLSQSATHAFLRVTPKTGRTHQIRVHLKSIGRPIVHDDLYAGDKVAQEDTLGFTRLALHAYSIEFTLPNGRRETFCAELPSDFMHAREYIATL